MRSNRDKSRGFTLAELLVAVFLLSAVMLALYTSFNSVTRVWRTSEADMQVYQDARIAMSVLSNDLQNIVGPAAKYMEGDNKALEFFAVVRPMHVEDGEDPRVMWVSYRLKPDPGTRGKTLVREERVVESPIPLPKEEPKVDSWVSEESQSRMLEKIDLGKERDFDIVSGVRTLEFSYYWDPAEKKTLLSKDAPLEETPLDSLEPIVVEEHPKGLGLPKAIGVSLTLYDGRGKNTDVTFRTLQPLRGPAGALADFGGTPR